MTGVWARWRGSKDADSREVVRFGAVILVFGLAVILAIFVAFRIGNDHAANKPRVESSEVGEGVNVSPSGRARYLKDARCAQRPAANSLAFHQSKNMHFLMEDVFLSDLVAADVSAIVTCPIPGILTRPRIIVREALEEQIHQLEGLRPISEPRACADNVGPRAWIVLFSKGVRRTVTLLDTSGCGTISDGATSLTPLSTRDPRWHIY